MSILHVTVLELTYRGRLDSNETTSGRVIVEGKARPARIVPSHRQQLHFLLGKFHLTKPYILDHLQFAFTDTHKSRRCSIPIPSFLCPTTRTPHYQLAL